MNKSIPYLQLTMALKIALFLYWVFIWITLPQRVISLSESFHIGTLVYECFWIREMYTHINHEGTLVFGTLKYVLLWIINDNNGK